MSSNSSQIEVGPNIILITRNDDNLQEVEADKVETTTEDPRNTVRNPNTRNNVDCYGVRLMKNKIIWRQRGIKMIQFQRNIGDFRRLLVKF